MLWPETIATVISSIVGGLMVTLLAAYLPRRTAVASSREAFMFALKDYDNTFSKLLDEARIYISGALVLQFIVGPAAVLTLFSISRTPSAFIMIATTYILIIIASGRTLTLVIAYAIRRPIKSKRLMGPVLNGISNNSSVATFTAVAASEQLLLILINAKLPLQIDLVITVLLLAEWLFVAYFPTILLSIFKYLDFFEYDEMIPWKLELVNIWLSDPDTRRGDSANGSPFVALFLDNGQKVEGRLVCVKVWGMILEDISKRAKLYIRWERIVTVELMAATN